MSVAVISLTYNRPEYIEQSFRSLYEKTERNFDHYVFDDNSNRETIKVLKELQNEYNFHLKSWNTHLNIAKSLMMSRLSLPTDYDFYLKFDSDMQVLSDRFLSGLVEVMEMPQNVGIAIPRVEGVKNEPDYKHLNIHFYHGHAVLLSPFPPWGSCMLMDNVIFLSYTEPEILSIGDENYGIDSRLTNYNQQLGNLTAVVKDLSIYHIDNLWGQRKDSYYFQEERGRRIWFDQMLPEFLRLSKEISPLYIDTEILKDLWRISPNYEELEANTYRYLLDMLDVAEARIEKEESNPKEDMKTIKVYKIISPANYPADPNIEHGSSIYTKELPDWAKGNPRVEVEEEEREILEESDLEGRGQTSEGVSGKSELVCEECGFEAKTKAGLKAHQRAKH